MKQATLSRCARIVREYRPDRTTFKVILFPGAAFGRNKNPRCIHRGLNAEHTALQELTMINTLVFCASMLLPLADAKTENKTEQKAEQKSEQSAEKKSDDLELLTIEANVVSYTNTERAKYKLPPLEVDKNLMESAREHCSWMTRNRIFSHTRRAVAENIAMGQSNSNEVVRAWMNSSGHRANILNPNNRRIGVGAYRTESGTIYWCQQFRQ
jgi:uncharacterized protein YkwD